MGGADGGVWRSGSQENDLCKCERSVRKNSDQSVCKYNSFLSVPYVDSVQCMWNRDVVN